ncbi:MAG: class II aldolase/adducin family protein [Bacteroidia bacterium]|nr:class II aldolase/adducin family protein [Bacteroidia bacterium]
MSYNIERAALVGALKSMLSSGLTTGSGGNISIRPEDADCVLVSPSGVPYASMTEDDLVLVDLQGNTLSGHRPPSSELAMHLAVYAVRPGCGAVVHTHSPYASTFACLREEISAVHYLIGFAGKTVPVAEYATYGTTQLARNAVDALGAGNAVLLANHGLLAVGDDVEHAYTVAEEVELVARIQYQARAIGTPVLLGDEEMERVIEKFRSYGRSDARERR